MTGKLLKSPGSTGKGQRKNRDVRLQNGKREAGIDRLFVDNDGEWPEGAKSGNTIDNDKIQLLLAEKCRELNTKR